MGETPSRINRAKQTDHVDEGSHMISRSSAVMSPSHPVSSSGNIDLVHQKNKTARNAGRIFER